jgi:hypothetical protein
MRRRPSARLLILDRASIADDFLGAAGGRPATAHRIDVRRVEEIAPALSGGVEDLVASRLVALEAEGHRPEAQPGDLQTGMAEFGVLHRISSLRFG